MRTILVVLCFVSTVVHAQILEENTSNTTTGCGIDQSCAALGYQATRTDGEPQFVCTAYGKCLDLGPGINNSICTNDQNGGEILMGCENAAIVRASQYFAGSYTCTNGAWNSDGCVYRNNSGALGGTVAIEDSEGLMINNGTPIKFRKVFKEVTDLGVVPANSTGGTTYTISGILLEDTVTVTPCNTLEDQIGDITAWVQSPNELALRVRNFSGADVDPAVCTFVFEVKR